MSERDEVLEEFDREYDIYVDASPVELSESPSNTLYVTRRDSYQTSYDWAREDGVFWEIYYANLEWIERDGEYVDDLIEINFEELVEVHLL